MVLPIWFQEPQVKTPVNHKASDRWVVLGSDLLLQVLDHSKEPPLKHTGLYL